MPYRHLTQLDREFIGQMAAAGVSCEQIAHGLGRHKSTISRELRRNSLRLGEGMGRIYLASHAQELAQRRCRERARKLKLQDEELKKEVESRLRKGWSPEQIASCSKKEDRRVSHETIYTHVQQDFVRGGKLYQCLRKRHRHRRRRCSSRRSRIVGRVSIHERPAEVELRNTAGHWEGDTVVGRGGRIITLVERCRRYMVAIKVPDGRSESVTRAIVQRMRRLSPSLRLTLTTDNGSEFAGHSRLSQSLGLAVYFADPHSPWQRGTNENANGLLRQFVPKGSDLKELSRQRLAQIVKLLNNRPRKVLNYQSPAAVLQNGPPAENAVALQP